NQDMRFDVPTIGAQTVQNVADAGGVAIAIEADRTILLDHEETVALADRLGVSIIAFRGVEPAVAAA
ncbi:MAG: UDP-2,3-diacylglucosamine diphosphatase LpxI domain-containing protein, partial [Rhodopirellula sp. JB044]|uniref:UDP-2,3-diacylglucosamine diphosphatase LpxI domain-containing protein n=1 Tax=Rhodopirellula sp. JB044 TaxID=3342844 RepID=UPI00370BCD0F